VGLRGTAAVQLLQGYRLRGFGAPRTMTPMKTIRKYPKRVDADLARTALDAASIPSVVAGLGIGIRGADEEISLLVPDNQVKAALRILDQQAPAPR
jgi:hypothetical protein